MPRSYYDIKGRPDEDAWYGAADKELTKLFDMGTFEIAETSSVPKGTKIMDTVFSFKRKEDSEGRLKELRCRINADGRQQEKGELRGYVRAHKQIQLHQDYMRIGSSRRAHAVSV